VARRWLPGVVRAVEGRGRCAVVLDSLDHHRAALAAAADPNFPSTLALAAASEKPHDHSLDSHQGINELTSKEPAAAAAASSAASSSASTDVQGKTEGSGTIGASHLESSINIQEVDSNTAETDAAPAATAPSAAVESEDASSVNNSDEAPMCKEAPSGVKYSIDTEGSNESKVAPSDSCSDNNNNSSTSTSVNSSNVHVTVTEQWLWAAAEFVRPRRTASSSTTTPATKIDGQDGCISQGGMKRPASSSSSSSSSFGTPSSKRAAHGSKQGTAAEREDLELAMALSLSLTPEASGRSADESSTIAEGSNLNTSAVDGEA